LQGKQPVCAEICAPIDDTEIDNQPTTTKDKSLMAEAAIGQAAETEQDTNTRWDFAVNLWDIVFIMLGISMIARETVMPVLLSHLTDSKVVIGLIPAIYSLGGSLPQLLIANFSEHLRYKKPFVMLIGGTGERGGYLLIGLSIWFFAESAPGVALALFFVFLLIPRLRWALAPRPGMT
jgi:hypothetical protein